MLDRPLRTAEFLVVDTETNGLAGDACELTEVGAVLVGGGELHDRWETLVGVRAPLRAASSASPASPRRWSTPPRPPRRRCPSSPSSWATGSSSRTTRRSTAGAAPGLRPRRRRLARPARAVHRRARAALHPLARQRRLAALAESLGRGGRGDPPRARRRRDLRARLLRAVPAAVRARRDDRRGARAAALHARTPSARGRDRRRARTAAPAGACRPWTGLPDEPGVYLVRNAEGQVLYVGKSVAATRWPCWNSPRRPAHPGKRRCRPGWRSTTGAGWPRSARRPGCSCWSPPPTRPGTRCSCGGPRGGCGSRPARWRPRPPPA